MPFTFNALKLYVLTINEKPWTRAKEVCKVFEYAKGRTREVLKKHVTISIKRGSTRCFFQVNSQKQKTLEDTVAMFCSYILDSSLVISYMRWKLKILQDVFRPLSSQINKNIKFIEKKLKKKMQQLHCSMMNTRMQHCMRKQMCIKLSYKDVKIQSPILGYVM